MPNSYQFFKDFINNAVPVSALDSDDKIVIVQNGQTKTATPDDLKAFISVIGWAPELAVVTDGARRVQQVADWFGGTGTKPAVGMYIGADGFVDDIEDAVDVRGAQGPQGEDGDGGSGGLDAAGVRAVTLTGLNVDVPASEPAALQASNSVLIAFGRLWAWVQWLSMLIGWMPKVYNVKRYGAIGDGVNSPERRAANTDAFLAAIQDVLDAGAGKILVPVGHFFVNPIRIPGVDPISSFDGIGWRTLEIAGEARPGQLFGTVGTAPLGTGGCIVECQSTAPGEAVFLQDEYPSGFASFSGVQLVFSNLDIRTYNNPVISGIDAGNAQQLVVHDCQITNGLYSVDSSLPTTATSTGIVMPRVDNGALNILRNVSISGYHNGVEVNEHSYGDYLNITCCLQALLFKAGNHASYFTRIAGQRNQRNLVFTEGTHRVTIAQLNLEHAAPGQTDSNNVWQLTSYDVYDPSNYGVGDVKWANTLGNFGIESTFTKLGGSNLHCTEIGSTSQSGGFPQVASFSAAIPFDGMKLMSKLVTGAIAFTAISTDRVAGARTLVRLVADGSNTPTFDSDFVFTSDSEAYDDTAGQVNNLDFYWNGHEYEVTIHQGGIATPAVSAIDVQFDSALNISEGPTGQWNNTFTGDDVALNNRGLDTTHVVSAGDNVLYYATLASATNIFYIALDDDGTPSLLRTPPATSSVAFAVAASSNSIAIAERGQDVGTAPTFAVTLPYASTSRFGIRVSDASTTAVVEAVYSTDAGATWTAVYTYTSTYAGDLFFKAVGVIPSTSLLNPRAVIS